MHRLVLVTLLFAALPAVGSEAPDKYRQLVRSDPLIHSLIEALREKHGGCPWLDSPHGNGGMSVMKEVEPYFYSEPGDYYQLQAGRLEVDLACFHAVSATVYSYYHDELGQEPIARFLRRIAFSYDDFTGYLSRYRTLATNPDERILGDPLVTRLYPLLAEGNGNCDKVADGKLDIESDKKYRAAWNDAQVEYQEFSLSYTCEKKSSGLVFRFKGNFFTRTGFVTWKELEKAGWVE